MSTLPTLPPRAAASHKGSFGTVLVVAGSTGMSGAAALSGMAALRGGAGRVVVAVPEPIAAIVAGLQPCYMTAPLPADQSGRLTRLALPTLLELASSATVVVVGPGLGQSEDISGLIRALVAEITLPLVLDADALNAIGQHTAVLKQRKQPFVLTPHPGEFARLIGSDTATVQASREDLAGSFAREHGGVLLLKGAGTIVTDGSRVHVNTTGNPGMATGGSGDVLTGLLGAVLAQKLPVFEATILAAFLHGRAGDLARDRLGEVGMIASDLIEYLPAAILSLDRE